MGGGNGHVTVWMYLIPLNYVHLKMVKMVSLNVDILPHAHMRVRACAGVHTHTRRFNVLPNHYLNNQVL